MFSKATKTLLKNHIRHTDTHNRMLEESDMWRLHEEKRTRKHDTATRRAHMDDFDSRKPAGTSWETSDTKRETFWMRRLQEVEENDPDRWGHAGYKELHPEEFNSSLSESSDSESQNGKKAKKRKSTKKEKKRKKKEKIIKKKKKHKKQKSSESDCESSSWECKRKSRKNKAKKRRNSTTDSSEDSNSDDCGSKRHKRKTQKRAYESDNCLSSDSNESHSEPKRQKLSSERTRSGGVTFTDSKKYSKSKKGSKHKKHKSATRRDSQENGIVWLEKTS